MSNAPMVVLRMPPMPLSLSEHGLALRPYRPEDKAYVLSTAIRSAYEVIRGPAVPKGAAILGIREVAEALLPYVLLACSAEDAKTIHAWIAVHNGKLFWIYVPHALRRRGIARAMLNEVLGGEKQRREEK